MEEKGFSPQALLAQLIHLTIATNLTIMLHVSNSQPDSSWEAAIKITSFCSCTAACAYKVTNMSLFDLAIPTWGTFIHCQPKKICS